jgi:hypothetical protein
MTNLKKAAITYWIGSIGQMAFVCTIFFVLKITHLKQQLMALRFISLPF